MWGVEFDSDDPDTAGRMTMTWTFTARDTGTRVAIDATDVPPAIDVEAHQQGLDASLANLAGLARGVTGAACRALPLLCAGCGSAISTADRCASPVGFSGATPGTTGSFGHGTARDSLRSAAGHRAHDGTGRAALPHAPTATLSSSGPATR